MVKDQVFEDVKQSLEAEKEAGIAIIEYVFEHYGEAETVELLGEFSWNEDYLGDSATLLIITALLGVHENKAWIDADEKIVITGSFDKDGNVLPVGGVALKALTAEEKEADIFIVPKKQIDAAYTWVSPNSDLTVVGVDTLDELIAWFDENFQ